MKCPRAGELIYINNPIHGGPTRIARSAVAHGFVCRFMRDGFCHFVQFGYPDPVITTRLDDGRLFPFRNIQIDLSCPTNGA